MPNSRDTDANLQEIDHALRRSAGAGAQFAVFPECALTGFVPRDDLSSDAIDAWIDRARELVASHGVATLLPSTVIRHGRRLNAALVISASGRVEHEFHKIGLTDSERLYFEPGTPHERRFAVDGRRFACILCREAEDAPWRYFDDRVDCVVWPGYWGWTHPVSWDDEMTRRPSVRDNVRAWNAPMVQATYGRRGEPPGPEGSTLGGCAIIGRDGELLSMTDPSEATSHIVDLTTL